jgi:hypothetical protein
MSASRKMRHESVQAVQEHLEDVGIATAWDEGQVFGLYEEREYLDVAGYFNIFCNDEGELRVSWFDQPAFADAEVQEVNPHIHYEEIDLVPPDSLQRLEAMLRKVMADYDKWALTHEENMNRIQVAYDRMEAQIKQRIADGKPFLDSKLVARLVQFGFIPVKRP